MRRVPILATLIVAAAVATMVALGFWQLDRAEWKGQLLVDLAAAQRRAPIDFDASPGAEPAHPILRAAITCTTRAPAEVRGGSSRTGDTGYRYLFPCTRPGLPRTLLIDAGWSKRPDLAVPAGISRRFTGILAEQGDGRLVLTPSEALAPMLQPSRPPSVEDIPNNHLAYAVQWFLFAAIAAIIYGLALRRRLSRPPGPPRSAGP